MGGIESMQTENPDGDKINEIAENLSKYVFEVNIGG